MLLFAASCGGGEPAGSTKVSLSDFNFNPKTLEVKAGKAVFYVVNRGATSHNMVILDSADKQVAKSDLVQAGNSNVFTVDNLPAGTYKVICDVAGHRELGMEGTLKAT